MGQVIIRNLEDSVIVALKQRAQREGKSLEQQLREILSEAVKPTRQEVIAEIDRIRAMTPKVPQSDSTEIIRAYRDAR